MPDLLTIDRAGPSDDAGTSPHGPGPWGRDLLVALGLLLLAYAPTTVALPVLWATSDGFVQGFPLAALVCYVLWRDRDRLLPPSSDSGGGLIEALAGLSALWMVSQIMSVQVGTQSMLVVILTVWGLQVLGPASFSVVAPAGATLLLATPVIDTFTPVLRELAIAMSGLFVRILRIPAEIEGDVIIIESGRFIVENGCAGYGYLMVALTLGAMYSHLFMRGWTTRIGVVALAGGISLVFNWIRITHLVLLGHQTQMESPIITDHVVHGWVVFCVGLIPFFALARWMERFNAPKADERPQSDLEQAVPSPAAWRRRLVIATGVAALGPVLFYIGALVPSAQVADLPIAPAEKGEGWVRAASDGAGGLAASVAPEWQIAYPGADRIETSRWARPDSLPDVFGRRLIYERQRQGAELINSLNRIAPDSMTLRERAIGPVDRTGRTVRETWVRAGDQAWLVWHYYRVAGTTTASSARAKLLELVAFATRRRQAELVTLAAPCGPESCEAAVGSLFHFLTGREVPTSEGAENAAAGDSLRGTPGAGADSAANPFQEPDSGPGPMGGQGDEEARRP